MRGAAVTLLGQLPHRWAAELLVAALVSSPHARSRVATALEASPVDVTDLLVEFLADPGPAVRYWSAVLLRRHPTASGLAPPNWGFGYRFEVQPRMNVRVDVGFGREFLESGNKFIPSVYFNFTEAF